MTPYIRAIRALTVTIFQRVYRPVAWGIGGILFLLLIVTIWLATSASTWWWLLLIILVPLTFISAAILFTVWQLSKKLQPRPLQKYERAKMLRFSDKLLRVAEVRATPLPVIAFFIAKDVIRGKKSTYIESIIGDSTSLKQDLVEIRDMFV